MNGEWRDVGELPVQNGKLYMPADVGEIDVAKFNGYVKIQEFEVETYVLGSTGSKSKRFYASRSTVSTGNGLRNLKTHRRVCIFHVLKR